MTVHERKVKLVGKHRKGCRALYFQRTGDRPTCWGPVAFGDYGHPIVTTARRYGKHGRAFKHWLRFVCNDTECRAELHILTDAILDSRYWIAASSL